MAEKNSVEINNRISFWNSFRKIFSNRIYVYLALFASVLFWLLVMIFSQYSWIKFVITTSLLGNIAKINLLFSAFIGKLTYFSPINYLLYLLMAILVGINISVMIFVARNYVKTKKSFGIGLGAIILGILGIGCASCGSLLLVGIFGASSLLSLVYLPLKGLEINLFVILILCISIYFSVKQTQKPGTCKIKI